MRHYGTAEDDPISSHVAPSPCVLLSRSQWQLARSEPDAKNDPGQLFGHRISSSALIGNSVSSATNSCMAPASRMTLSRKLTGRDCGHFSLRRFARTTWWWTQSCKTGLRGAIYLLSMEIARNFFNFGSPRGRALSVTDCSRLMILANSLRNVAGNFLHHFSR